MPQLQHGSAIRILYDGHNTGQPGGPYATASQTQWRVCMLSFRCETYKIYSQKQRIGHWQMRKGAMFTKGQKAAVTRVSYISILHSMVIAVDENRGGLGALTLMYKGDEGTNCSDCVTDVTTSMQTSP